MEAISAFGLFAGPIIGSGMNYLLGYWIPFVIFGGIGMLCIITSMINIPPDEEIHYQSKKKAKLPMN
jgi:putative Mn2+ efflux pump MntP